MSGYEDACPIATVALEVASTSEPLRQATDRVFHRWIESFAPRLAIAGVSAERARPLAISVICLLEGAFILSRAARTPDAMLACGESAAALVQAALVTR